MKKRLLSLALAVVMACGLLPVTASAAATVTQVVPYKYNYVGDFSEGLAVVRNDNGWGAIDATGKEVIPCGTFDGSWVGEFHDGCLSIGADGGRRGEAGEYQLVTWSFVDVTGKTIFPEAITRTYSNWGTVAGVGPESAGKTIRFYDGLAAVELDSNTNLWDYGSKWGFIDPTGKEVVPCKYDSVSNFSEGLAAVGVGDWGTDYKYGFIDKTGKEIVPPKYDRVGDFSDGLAAVELDGKWGFIDAAGREVIPCQYSSAEAFENGRAVVKGSTGQIANGHTVYAEGVIDKSGNVMVPFGQYKAPDGEYHDGLKAVWKNGKLGFVDQVGSQIIPAKYDSPQGVYSYIPSFTNGLAAVYLSGKGYGYIDLHGNEVIPFQYGEARRLSEGMLAVGVDGKWGFVRVEGLPTTPGAPIVEPEKPATPDTSKDFGVTKEGRLWQYNGPGGNVVIPDGVTIIDNGAFLGKDNIASVVIPSSVTSIEQMAFHNCANLTSVTLPHSVTSIEDMTFSQNPKLTNLTIPNSVTSIGHQAFTGCTSLTSMTIPESVTEIASYAFSACSGLTSVTLPSGLASIEPSLFRNCDSLTSVVIPGKVTSIGTSAFFDCDNLTGVTIPASVTSIRDHAFTGCNKLTDVYYGGSQAQWNAMTLDTSKNEPLARATIHYNSAMPAQPVQPTVPTAYASTQVVQVDGKSVTFNAYALKDANGNDTNYIKLRDVADVLNGSAAQFEVGWDGTISITTGQLYTPNGSENIQNFKGNQSYTVSTSPVTINGVTANLEAITLTGADGGGYTYFKLRDLGAALGFNVTWSAETGITIDPNSPYDANN